MKKRKVPKIIFVQSKDTSEEKIARIYDFIFDLALSKYHKKILNKKDNYAKKEDKIDRKTKRNFKNK